MKNNQHTHRSLIRRSTHLVAESLTNITLDALSEIRGYSVESSQVVVRPGGSNGGGTRSRMQTGETLVHLRRGRSPGRSVLPAARVTNTRNLSQVPTIVILAAQCLSSGERSLRTK